MHLSPDPLLLGFSSQKSLTLFVMSFEQSLKGGG